MELWNDNRFLFTSYQTRGCRSRLSSRYRRKWTICENDFNIIIQDGCYRQASAASLLCKITNHLWPSGLFCTHVYTHRDCPGIEQADVIKLSKIWNTPSALVLCDSTFADIMKVWSATLSRCALNTESSSSTCPWRTSSTTISRLNIYQPGCQRSMCDTYCSQSSV